MKLLLTSAGVKNPSIHDALLEMLGKPIAESSALCIPTSIYGMKGGAYHAWKFLSGTATTNFSTPCYAIDDETAIQVLDGKVKVISEGHWTRFHS
jgi:hypothetical protein